MIMDYIGNISDVLGIISCIISVLIFLMSRSIFKNAQMQKVEYNYERRDIQTSLSALRMNIWEDNLDNLQIRSNMREALYSYLGKYWNISSPFCLFHLWRSLRYCKKPIKERHKEKLCISIDFLIAHLNKKEIVENEQSVTQSNQISDSEDPR